MLYIASISTKTLIHAFGEKYGEKSGCVSYKVIFSPMNERQLQTRGVHLKEIIYVDSECYPDYPYEIEIDKADNQIILEFGWSRIVLIPWLISSILFF